MKAMKPLGWNDTGRLGKVTANMELDDNELRVFVFRGFECASVVKMSPWTRGAPGDLDAEELRIVFRLALALVEAGAPLGEIGFGKPAGYFIDRVPVLL